MNDLEEFYKRLADRAMEKFKIETIARNELNRKIEAQVNGTPKRFRIYISREYKSTPEQLANKKKYYLAHREEICAKYRAYYHENRATVQAYQREYYRLVLAPKRKKCE